MLILTRRYGEAVNIGDDIKITVLGVKGNQVRLGFDAPKEVLILRDELEVNKKTEKEVCGNVY